jgi:hypothetical protein
MERHPDSRLNATATLAFLAGLFGSLCPAFWGTGGVGAIVLGAAAHSEIKRSEGRQHGTGMAIAGIALGVVHVLALVIGVAVLLVLGASGGPLASGPVPPPAYVAPTPTPKAAPSSIAPTTDPNATASRESRTQITRFGGVTLVDPGPRAARLTELIAAEQSKANGEGQKLVVWITAPDCRPCTGVSVALSSPLLQKALAGVRLLRLDVSEYRIELAERGLTPEVLPGFALVGPTGQPTDYVNGGEWDADIPENIAPVLRKFVQGTYKTRRSPWTGVPTPGDALL